MIRDLTRAFRTLRRSPGFTALTVLTLGLGIGATTTLFSVLDSVLWRPLKFAQSERLVSVLEGGSGDNQPTSPACFTAIRDAGSLVDVTATYMWNPVLRGTDRPSEVRGLRTTPGLFDLLRRRAQIGRSFTADLTDAPEEESRVVVLSHGLWQRVFGGDPDILGRQVSLDGVSFNIVGVMPPDFAFPTFWADGAELWAPFLLTPEASRSGSRFLRVFARLDDGASLGEAQAEMDVLAERLRREDPEGNEDLRLHVAPLMEPTVGHARTALWVLFGMVGLVLLIACANVASLFLARAAGRRREIAVRLAMGAGRARLMSELFLAESLLLALLGGAVGLALSAWSLEALVAFGSDDIPRLAEIELDLQGLAFTLVISLLTSVFFGLVPSLALRDSDLRQSLHQSARSVGLPPGDRLRRGLVVAEVTLTVVLLAGAGLLARSFQHLSSFDPGFERRDVLTLQLSLRGTRHAEPERQNAFFESLLEEVGAVPGVLHAGLMNHLPVGDDIWTHAFRISGRGEPVPGETPKATVRVASPGLFETLDIQLLAGRTFSDSDDEDAPRVALINQTLARRYFPGEDPVGQRFRHGRSDSDGPEWTIIGVVHDIQQYKLTDVIRPEIVFPYAQNPLGFWPKASLVVRTATDPAALAATIQDRLWALEPELSISNVRSMEALLTDSIGATGFQTFTLTLFALLGIVLSTVGVYGVMSYLVAWRRSDIGVRMAVGADRSQILHWVLGDGLRLAVWGVVLGLALAWLTGGAMAGLLHGVDPNDALTLVAAAVGLLIVAGAATLLPAYRAARLDPLHCLRQE